MKRGALLAALLWPGVAMAQTAPHIWAVRGLYGLDRSACGSDGSGEAANTAMIAPPLCANLDDAARQTIGQHFVDAMAAHFPGVEARFGQSLPSDATPRARLAGSLIASLSLTRAVIWRVDKQAGTDAFLPITLTLDITNATTGEVVFTRTRSQIPQGSYAPSAVEAALTAQFPAKLDETMQALVVEAAADWKPWAQTATVVARAGDSWIVDRGRALGLRAGDAVGEDGHITYAGAGYAVVRPTLGGYTIGQTLTRTTVTPAEMLSRPSVLTVLNDAPDGYAAPYLTGIFEEALGAHAGFAPMPVNPGFAHLRSMALGEAQSPSTESRSLPDYVAVVRVVLLPSASFASNIPGITIERHDARAFVTLVDRTGRAVFAVQGSGRIVDQVSGATRFAIEQRHDTAIRNALIDAATHLMAFRPQPLTLPITRAGDRVVIGDSGGALPLNAQLTVLRDTGTVKGVEGHVRVPVGQVTTGEIASGGVLANNADPIPLDLHAGDVVAIDQAGPPLLARRAVMQCVDPSGHPRIEDRGQLPATVWAEAAGASFAAHYRGPVRVAGLADRLAAFGADFAGWDRYAPAGLRDADSCFVPVVAVAAPAPSDHGGAYRLTAGFALMRGDTKLKGGGVQVALKPTALPAGASAGTTAAMLQQDLADQLPVLADRAATALEPQM